jgi:hypothetical protein
MATGLPYLLETAFLFISASDFQRNPAVNSLESWDVTNELFLLWGFPRIKSGKLKDVMKFQNYSIPGQK